MFILTYEILCYNLNQRGVLIVPGMVPHFFCGATAGIYGNATGGRRGAIIGAFVNGLMLAFLPALLLPVLGNLGFANTTFGDVDFAVLGLAIGKLGEWMGNIGIYGLIGVTLVALILPSILKPSDKPVNYNVE